MSGHYALSDFERAALVAALPKLWSCAEEMGVIGKPLADWRKEEVLGFLGLAYEAVTAHPVTHTKDFDDAIPFGSQLGSQLGSQNG